MPKLNDSSTPKSQVSTTLRISNEQSEFIKSLMDQMAMSKQGVMSFLLEEGSKVVKKNIYEEIDKLCSESPFYLFNLLEGDEQMMMKNSVIASKEIPLKTLIRKIKAKRKIFLYSEEKGVIAYGTTTEEYYEWEGYACKKLSDFQALDFPVPTSELKKIFGLNLASTKKIISLPEGDKILSLINASSHSCPKCGIEAIGLSEIQTVFGLRNTGKGISHQSWCRVCRQKTNKA